VSMDFSYLHLKNASEKEMRNISHSIRQTIIKTISKTGGHLSSNLGTVELIMALLSSFDPLEDDILFDVGHQCYPYKILTGRSKQFSTIRQENGISGYPDPRESIYDKFISGHSSTALSVALGFAISKKLTGGKSHTVAIVGDGALTGGEAYEAINNIGHLGLPILLILNDNEMSISKNVGSIAKILSKIRSSLLYRSMSWKYKKIWLKLGIFGKMVLSITEKCKDMIKGLLYPKMFFEEIGFTYLGPIDGHEINEMKLMLARAKQYDKPVILHVMTKKGKGYSCVEKNPTAFHSSPKFTIEGDEFVIGKAEHSYSEVFGSTLVQLAEKDNRIVGLTAAMAEGLCMKEFSDLFPHRFFDMGITEQNLVTVAAAMAQKGLRPIVGIYSTFLQRAYDQIIHDCSILSEPVIFAVDRAGAVSGDGPTHQGSFDIAFISPIPNTIIMAPSSESELKKMLTWSVLNTTKTTFIRYPKASVSYHEYKEDIQLGKAVLVESGVDGYFIVLGPLIEIAKESIRLLKQKNIQFGLIDARFAKPYDAHLFEKVFQQTSGCVTLEDGVLSGGFGNQVLDSLNRTGSLEKRIFLSFGLHSDYPMQMKRENLLIHNGLHPEVISDTILLRMKKN
jgi:1-deoxy-D-xylulose-5-phosphate synthase